MVIILTYFMTIFLAFIIPRFLAAGSEFLEQAARPPNSAADVQSPEIVGWRSLSPVGER
jgi:hypothetical protein